MPTLTWVLAVVKTDEELTRHAIAAIDRYGIAKVSLWAQAIPGWLAVVGDRTPEPGRRSLTPVPGVIRLGPMTKRPEVTATQLRDVIVA